VAGYYFYTLETSVESSYLLSTPSSSVLICKSPNLGLEIDFAPFFDFAFSSGEGMITTSIVKTLISN